MSFADVNSVADEHEGAAPPAARRWYVLAVLTLLLMLGMVDRLSLSLLVEPIKHDLAIGDTQMSLLLGASFALFYSLMGLPAGHFVDRGNRRNLMLAGALVWTAMTFASAFALSFGWLFVCRAGVGVGEAVLSPAIYSIIRDSFPPRQRATAFGINNIGSPLGTGLALIVIGHIAGAAAAGLFAGMPLIGGLAGWRAVLALVGLGGIPFALLLLTIREPARGASAPGDASVAAVRAHFAANRIAYLALFASTACYGIGLNGMLSWLPTAILRGWNVPVSAVGARLGILQIVAAPLGLLTAGSLLSLLARRGLARLTPYLGGGALLVAAGLIAAWSMTLAITTGWTLLAALLFLTPWCGVTVATMLARITPSRMMGKISAVNFLMLGLVGMIVGPTLNPLLSRLFVGPRAMQHGIGLGSGVAMLLSGGALLLAGVALNRAGTRSTNLDARVAPRSASPT